MKQSKFVIETFPGQSFEGYSDDRNWLGWAIPYFTFEQSLEIVQAHVLAGQKARYDETGDRFVFEVDGNEEFYSCLEDDGKKLYPVGNGEWIWEESDD